MFTRLGLILLAICAFGAFSVLSNDDYKEAKKAAEPVKTKHIESFAEYQDRIERIQEYALQRHFDELLSMENKK